jgi:hypothetical protein
MPRTNVVSVLRRTRATLPELRQIRGGDQPGLDPVTRPSRGAFGNVAARGVAEAMGRALALDSGGMGSGSMSPAQGSFSPSCGG